MKTTNKILFSVERSFNGSYSIHLTSDYSFSYKTKHPALAKKRLLDAYFNDSLYSLDLLCSDSFSKFFEYSFYFDNVALQKISSYFNSYTYLRCSFSSLTGVNSSAYIYLRFVKLINLLNDIFLLFDALLKKRFSRSLSSFVTSSNIRLSSISDYFTSVLV